jgi:ABC-type polysaccharide/polyol phosphate transport system ATPase subunit
MNAVTASGLSKNYPLVSGAFSRLRHMFHRDPGSGIWALRDVTFDVRRGEAFGIVGSNGSGKSTLLQIIAGILRPDAGTISAEGRLAALLELGSGFSPEFTGRENIYLNASILGLSKEEIDARMEAIEAFAEIGEFLDRPVRTYSSGMVLRVAFAAAAHTDPEVLIVDEALAVGDIGFRQRCMRRIHQLRARGCTILFVSHDTGDVKALCDRCLWLDHGRVRELGDSDQVVAAYLQSTLDVREPTAAIAERPVISTSGARFGDGRAEIMTQELAGRWRAGANLNLRVTVRGRATLQQPIVGFLLRNERGETIFGTNTSREDSPVPVLAAGMVCVVDFHFMAPALSPGRYRISLAISDGTMDQFAVADYVEDAIEVDVAGDSARGYVRLPCEIAVTYGSGPR